MIIFINGSINSGKSTIAKILRKRIKQTVVVEADSFYYFIGDDDDIERIGIENIIPVILKNATSSIRVFAEEGYNVIVPYPISQKNHDFFVDKLNELKVPMVFFTLAPKLEIALQNRGGRELNDWERKRIIHHYDMGIHSPKFGTIIDNSKQTPDETAEEILQYLNLE